MFPFGYLSTKKVVRVHFYAFFTTTANGNCSLDEPDGMPGGEMKRGVVWGNKEIVSCLRHRGGLGWSTWLQRAEFTQPQSVRFLRSLS